MPEPLMISIFVNIFLGVSVIGLLIINRLWKRLYFQKVYELSLVTPEMIDNALGKEFIKGLKKYYNSKNDKEVN